MYNQSYEDYIRSILGYPNYGEQDYFYTKPKEEYNLENSPEDRSSELEECYPEIYKIVYPMVKKACEKVTAPVTKETVDNLVQELYINIEGNDTLNSNNAENIVSVKEEKRDSISPVRTFNGKPVKEEPKKEPTNNTRAIKEEPRQTRQFNPFLSDLIRILLLRELVGRPDRPGYRPPFPPPGRPPFPPPGRPPFPPPGRPPYNRQWDGDIYEY